MMKMPQRELLDYISEISERAEVRQALRCLSEVRR